MLDDNKFICKEDYLAGKAPTHNRESLFTIFRISYYGIIYYSIMKSNRGVATQFFLIDQLSKATLPPTK